jgi:uncharacterized alpha-E superfamily protein
MMLSRVADNLYWMSRYLERAEHTARLIDVNLTQMLDQNASYADQRWERLHLSLRIPPFAEDVNDAYSVTRALTFDADDSASIVSCITAARENARQLREQISSEMWEQLNRLYIQIKRTTMDEIWFTEPHAFLATVKESVQLFQGITDATMSHSEGWHFIRVGRFIERTSATAALIDVNVNALAARSQEEIADASESADDWHYLGWVGLLRSCAAFESYCKVYTAKIQPEKIVEFLLLNAESPRSVRFAATMIQIALQAIAKATNTRHAARVDRLAGRLRAGLDYSQVEEVMDNIHGYLENVQRQCTQIHNAIHQAYVAYPIDILLIAGGTSR